MQATGCAAYSNSRHPWSIMSVANAVLKTALTCAVGGKQGNFPNFSPQPKSGCPSVADPLAARVAPAVGACDKQNYVVTSSAQLVPELLRWTYSHGQRHRANLIARHQRHQKWSVENHQWRKPVGNNVGFYLTGSGAVLDFEANSTINQRLYGRMAGLLVFEDRTNASGALHQILSNNAQTLLGTIYLPQGRFFVGSTLPWPGTPPTPSWWPIRSSSAPARRSC